MQWHVQTLLQMALAVINFVTIGEGSSYTGDFLLLGRSCITQSHMPPFFFPLPSERDNCFFPTVWIVQLTLCRQFSIAVWYYCSPAPAGLHNI